MSEPSARLKAALAQVRAPWDEARTEHTLRVLPQRQHRHRRARRVRAVFAAGAGAVLSVGCIVVWLAGGPARFDWLPHQPTTRQSDARAHDAQRATQAAAEPPITAGQQLRLSDGSTVALLDAHTDVVVEESSERLVALRVARGRARIDAPALPERVFQLRTAQVTCQVLGAVFEVAQQAESTWLRVERGQLVVTSAAPPRTLDAGQEAWFRAPSTLSSLPPVPPSSPSASPKPAPRASPRPHAGAEESADTWREHAESGDFKRAFPLLPSADTTLAMSVSELLLAADAARLSGHPEAALPYLRRVVAQHAHDARAPLAAFTLGGVLMNQLGMPREAEAAYAKARATSLGGALAQDALARQVEAAHRAGDEALARSLAREYLQRYPQGRRVQAVRRFGGL